jgi:hypothetical protein
MGPLSVAPAKCQQQLYRIFGISILTQNLKKTSKFVPVQKAACGSAAG